MAQLAKNLALPVQRAELLTSAATLSAASRGVVDEEQPRQRRKRKKIKTSPEAAAAAIASSGVETFLRIGAVLLATGCSRSTVYAMMAEARRVFRAP